MSIGKNLLSYIHELPGCTVYPFQEDLETRTINVEKVIIQDDFYYVRIKDMMEHCKCAYTF